MGRDLFLTAWRMLSFWNEDTKGRIEAEAESLIQHLGRSAFDVARRMELDASDFPSVPYWRSVRKAIARETEIETFRL